MAVAWDSYRNGNYDVYARTYSGNAWGDEIPVAATARYEAYPSIAYDGTGRLWIAYEEGGRGWGKDFGAYRTTGVALYQGRLIKLRGLEPNGSFVDLDASLDSVLVGAPNRARGPPGKSGGFGILGSRIRTSPCTGFRMRISLTTIPGLRRTPCRAWPWMVRGGSGWPSAPPIPPGGVRSEPSGRSIWCLLMAKSWTQPIFLDHTDNLVGQPAGLGVAGAMASLLMVNSSDGRRDSQSGQDVDAREPNRRLRGPLQQRPLEPRG